MSRISADDLAHSRAFSTAIDASKRPTAEQKTEEVKTVRHFNTSRTLKAVNDSSTIDFAYMPDFDPDNAEAALRVPLLPTNFFPARVGAHGPEAAEEVRGQRNDDVLNIADKYNRSLSNLRSTWLQQTRSSATFRRCATTMPWRLIFMLWLSRSRRLRKERARHR